LVRVTADSNIYISALQFGRQPLRLLDLAADDQIELAISEPILAEVERVLRDKFKANSERLESVRRTLLELAQYVTPAQPLDVVKFDPDDNRIVECAVSAGSQVIVTGDKHLLQLRHYGSIEILRLSDFFARVQQQY
jgi:putative PIN family toxin of toxin-antitoxin system